MESTKTYNERYYCWEWRNSQGQWHRENDLPAVEYDSGNKYWYVNGKRHRENDLPAIEYVNVSKYWYINGQLHRENDLPAIEYDCGYKAWYLNGQLHRENGPAIIWANGYVEYLKYGVRIQSEEERQKVKIARLEEFDSRI